MPKTSSTPAKSDAVERPEVRAPALDRGSNFRDLGGYSAQNGRRVRWRAIYRSGATPLFTDDDIAYVATLGLRHIIDLRSTEERALAPSLLAGLGAKYFAVDYSAATIFRHMIDADVNAAALSSRALYCDWLTSLAPQYEKVFGALLANDGAVMFNCSAGQDRTGVAAALVLSALGVSRDEIYADYHLSTELRRPEHEVPPFDAADFPDNPVAQFYAHVRQTPDAWAPKPLYRDDGEPKLADMFEAVEARWGSVNNYLDKVLGVDASGLEQLKAHYLE